MELTFHNLKCVLNFTYGLQIKIFLTLVLDVSNYIMSIYNLDTFRNNQMI